MSRSIKTLRPPYAERVTNADIRATALDYVRKVAGVRTSAAHNAEAFELALDEVTRSTQAPLGALVVRGAPHR